MIRDALLKGESGAIPLDELPDIIPYYEIVRHREDEVGRRAQKKPLIS
jgi:hypothetical protein